MFSPDFFFTQSVIDPSDLNGARGVETITLGGRTFLYVAGQASDVISIFEIFPDGSVLPVDTVTNDTTVLLNGVSGLISATVGANTYLYAVSEFDDAINVFSVAADGSLTVVQLIQDDATLELDVPFGETTVAEAGGNQFLIVHGNVDDGLSVFRIENDGTLTNTSNVDNLAAGTLLDNIAATATAQVGGTTYVYATSRTNDAINIFSLSAGGVLTHIVNIIDDATFELNGAYGIETATIGGQQFLFVAGADDDGISVFSIGATGIPSNVFNYTDTTALPLNGATDIEVFSHEGKDFLLVTGQVDDGLGLFEIASDGSLTLIDTVFDSENGLFTLNDTRDAVFSLVNGVPFVIATGIVDDGFSLFQLKDGPETITGTSGPDVLLGTVDGDSIDGVEADDVLVGLEGKDTMTGGEGSDLLSGGLDDDILRGDGILTQSATDSVTVSETQQTLALTVTLPERGDGTTTELTGLITRTEATNASFNIAYVIDVSGSMGSAFTGLETVGDENGDGLFNTLLDGVVVGYKSLNQSLIDAGYINSDVAIIPFDSNVTTSYLGPILGDVGGALEDLRDLGGTNFEIALQQAITTLGNMGPGFNRVFFISDGDNNEGGTFTDEVATLIDPNGLNAEITALPLGSGASLGALDLVDDGLANNSVTRVLEPSTLTSGLLQSPVSLSEVDRVEVYVNGVLQVTLPNSVLTETPLGLQFSATVPGLLPNADDDIRVVLVASDTASTTVDVELTLPNAPIDYGNDTLLGGAGDDILIGDDGNDLLFGEGGADTLRGGPGDDTYYVDVFDVLDESDGRASDFDTIVSRNSIDLGAASLQGSFEGATLIGQADVNATGNDLNNQLLGNVGANDLTGFGGDDTLIGFLEDDLLSGGGGNDSLLGSEGNDTIFGNSGNDTMLGGLGNDLMRGAVGNDVLLGGDDNDTLYGGGDEDLIDGGRNDDMLFGENGRDTLLGGDGADSINGGAQSDELRGGAGQDTLFGASGFDQLFGGDENDQLDGGTGDDTLVGGNGRDSVFGGDGNDLLDGGNQSDRLRGMDGNDTLFGGTGFDDLFGGANDDVLNGGAGNDTLFGEGGSDVFVFTNDWGIDRVADFDATNPAEDIDLSGVTAIIGYGDLTANHLFQVGTNVEIRDLLGNIIVVENVLVASLTADNFIF